MVFRSFILFLFILWSLESSFANSSYITRLESRINNTAKNLQKIQNTIKQKEAQLDNESKSRRPNIRRITNLKKSILNLKKNQEQKKNLIITLNERVKGVHQKSIDNIKRKILNRIRTRQNLENQIKRIESSNTLSKLNEFKKKKIDIEVKLTQIEEKILSNESFCQSSKRRYQVRQCQKRKMSYAKQKIRLKKQQENILKRLKIFEDKISSNKEKIIVLQNKIISLETLDQKDQLTIKKKEEEIITINKTELLKDLSAPTCFGQEEKLVCGYLDEFRTFKNKCYLEKAQAFFAYDGKCQKGHYFSFSNEVNFYEADSNKLENNSQNVGGLDYKKELEYKLAALGVVKDYMRKIHGLQFSKERMAGEVKLDYIEEGREELQFQGVLTDEYLKDQNSNTVLVNNDDYLSELLKGESEIYLGERMLSEKYKELADIQTKLARWKTYDQDNTIASVTNGVIHLMNYVREAYVALKEKENPEKAVTEYLSDYWLTDEGEKIRESYNTQMTQLMVEIEERQKHLSSQIGQNLIPLAEKGDIRFLTVNELINEINVSGEKISNDKISLYKEGVASATELSFIGVKKGIEITNALRKLEGKDPLPEYKSFNEFSKEFSHLKKDRDVIYDYTMKNTLISEYERIYGEHPAFDSEKMQVIAVENEASFVAFINRVSWLLDNHTDQTHAGVRAYLKWKKENNDKLSGDELQNISAYYSEDLTAREMWENVGRVAANSLTLTGFMAITGSLGIQDKWIGTNYRVPAMELVAYLQEKTGLYGFAVDHRLGEENELNTAGESLSEAVFETALILTPIKGLKFNKLKKWLSGVDSRYTKALSRLLALADGAKGLVINKVIRREQMVLQLEELGIEPESEEGKKAIHLAIYGTNLDVFRDIVNMVGGNLARRHKTIDFLADIAIEIDSENRHRRVSEKTIAGLATKKFLEKPIEDQAELLGKNLNEWKLLSELERKEIVEKDFLGEDDTELFGPVLTSVLSRGLRSISTIAINKYNQLNQNAEVNSDRLIELTNNEKKSLVEISEKAGKKQIILSKISKGFEENDTTKKSEAYTKLYEGENDIPKNIIEQVKHKMSIDLRYLFSSKDYSENFENVYLNGRLKIHNALDSIKAIQDKLYKGKEISSEEEIVYNDAQKKISIINKVTVLKLKEYLDRKGIKNEIVELHMSEGEGNKTTTSIKSEINGLEVLLNIEFLAKKDAGGAFHPNKTFTDEQGNEQTKKVILVGMSDFDFENPLKPTGAGFDHEKFHSRTLKHWKPFQVENNSGRELSGYNNFRVDEYRAQVKTFVHQINMAFKILNSGHDITNEIKTIIHNELIERINTVEGLSGLKNIIIEVENKIKEVNSLSKKIEELESSRGNQREIFSLKQRYNKLVGENFGVNSGENKNYYIFTILAKDESGKPLKNEKGENIIDRFQIEWDKDDSTIDFSNYPQIPGLNELNKLKDETLRTFNLVEKLIESKTLSDLLDSLELDKEDDIFDQFLVSLNSSVKDNSSNKNNVNNQTVVKPEEVNIEQLVNLTEGAMTEETIKRIILINSTNVLSTSFPKEWSSEDIINSILEVAEKASPQNKSDDGTVKKQMLVSGVLIEVIIDDQTGIIIDGHVIKIQEALNPPETNILINPISNSDGNRLNDLSETIDKSLLENPSEKNTRNINRKMEQEELEESPEEEEQNEEKNEPANTGNGGAQIPQGQDSIPQKMEDYDDLWPSEKERFLEQLKNKNASKKIEFGAINGWDARKFETFYNFKFNENVNQIQWQSDDEVMYGHNNCRYGSYIYRGWNEEKGTIECHDGKDFVAKRVGLSVFLNSSYQGLDVSKFKHLKNQTKSIHVTRFFDNDRRVLFNYLGEFDPISKKDRNQIDHYNNYYFSISGGCGVNLGNGDIEFGKNVDVEVNWPTGKESYSFPCYEEKGKMTYVIDNILPRINYSGDKELLMYPSEVELTLESGGTYFGVIDVPEGVGQNQQDVEVKGKACYREVCEEFSILAYSQKPVLINKELIEPGEEVGINRKSTAKFEVACEKGLKYAILSDDGPIFKTIKASTYIPLDVDELKKQEKRLLTKILILEEKLTQAKYQSEINELQSEIDRLDDEKAKIQNEKNAKMRKRDLEAHEKYFDLEVKDCNPEGEESEFTYYLTYNLDNLDGKSDQKEDLDDKGQPIFDKSVQQSEVDAVAKKEGVDFKMNMEAYLNFKVLVFDKFGNSYSYKIHELVPIINSSGSGGGALLEGIPNTSLEITNVLMEKEIENGKIDFFDLPKQIDPIKKYDENRKLINEAIYLAPRKDRVQIKGICGSLVPKVSLVVSGSLKDLLTHKNVIISNIECKKGIFSAYINAKVLEGIEGQLAWVFVKNNEFSTYYSLNPEHLKIENEEKNPFEDSSMAVIDFRYSLQDESKNDDLPKREEMPKENNIRKVEDSRLSSRETYTETYTDTDYDTAILTETNMETVEEIDAYSDSYVTDIETYTDTEYDWYNYELEMYGYPEP